MARQSELHAECVTWAGKLADEAHRPAGMVGITRTLVPRFALYPQPKRTQEEWDAWWSDYNTAVGHMPLEALDAAMRAWIRKPDSQFLPTPGQLLALAREQPTRAARRAVRAVRVAGLTPGLPEAEQPPARSQEDRDKVRRMAKEFHLKELADPRTIPAYEFRAAAVGEDGITDQMRARMLRLARGG